MLTAPVERFLGQASASQVTDIFMFLVVGFFLIGLVNFFVDRDSRFVKTVPSLLTTLGILGTFTGIVIGLLGFDVQNIDDSIAGLLSGLKTAFITSLLGLTGSIIFKAITSAISIQPKSAEEAEPADRLLFILQEQTDELRVLSGAVGGDIDSSLVSQVKMLRADHNDRAKVAAEAEKLSLQRLEGLVEHQSAQAAEFKAFQERLWRQMQEFGDIMSKSATEQIIAALKEVIVDFNNNLTEQFGENFKQLNAAVESLVQWQENYKVQLAEMHEQYELSVRAITVTQQSVEQISAETQSIPENMSELKEAVALNRQELLELTAHLGTFAEIRDKAVEALPAINESIQSSVEGMGQAAEKMNAGMTQAIDSTASRLDELGTALAGKVSESVESASDLFGKSVEKLSDSLAEGTEEFVSSSHQVNSSLQSTSDSLQASSQATQTMFEDMLQDLNASLRGLVENLSDGNEKVTATFEASVTSARETIEGTSAEMAKHTAEITNQVGDEIKSVLAEQEKASEHVLQTIKNIAGSTQQSVADSSEAILKQVSDVTEETAAELRELLKAQDVENRRVLTGLKDAAESALTDTQESLTKQVAALDKATEHELNQVMGQMGKALAQITEKFTADYVELTNAMHRIVEQSRRA